MKQNSKKYHTIYADPPWHHAGGKPILRMSTEYGSHVHYPLMKTAEIIALKNFIAELAEKDCHLYLWVTNTFLEHGLLVMKEWGFKYKTKIDWLKTGKNGKLSFGFGNYFRGCTESCLFGVKGHLPYKMISGKRATERTGFLASRGRHSEKPEEMRKKIEKISYPEYVELFARKRTPGWDVWGNEV